MSLSVPPSPPSADPPVRPPAAGLLVDKAPEKHSRESRTERATTRDFACRLYTHGMSVRRVAAAIGRSYGYTHRLLAEARVTMRPRTPTGPDEDELRETIARLFRDEGRSIPQIARTLGRSYYFVRSRVLLPGERPPARLRQPARPRRRTPGDGA